MVLPVKVCLLYVVVQNATNYMVSRILRSKCLGLLHAFCSFHISGFDFTMLLLSLLGMIRALHVSKNDAFL